VLPLFVLGVFIPAWARIKVVSRKSGVFNETGLVTKLGNGLVLVVAYDFVFVQKDYK